VFSSVQLVFLSCRLLSVRQNNHDPGTKSPQLPLSCSKLPSTGQFQIGVLDFVQVIYGKMLISIRVVRGILYL